MPTFSMKISHILLVLRVCADDDCQQKPPQIVTVKLTSILCLKGLVSCGSHF